MVRPRNDHPLILAMPLNFSDSKRNPHAPPGPTLDLARPDRLPHRRRAPKKLRHRRRVLAAVKRGDGKLDMRKWHTCETTHCRAGWAVVLAGKPGKDLEARVGSQTAGTLIYLKSRPSKRLPDFFASDAEAMADLEACAKQ